MHYNTFNMHKNSRLAYILSNAILVVEYFFRMAKDTDT